MWTHVRLSLPLRAPPTVAPRRGNAGRTTGSGGVHRQRLTHRALARANLARGIFEPGAGAHEKISAASRLKLPPPSQILNHLAPPTAAPGKAAPPHNQRKRPALRHRTTRAAAGSSATPHALQRSLHSHLRLCRGLHLSTPSTSLLPSLRKGTAALPAHVCTIE